MKDVSYSPVRITYGYRGESFVLQDLWTHLFRRKRRSLQEYRAAPDFQEGYNVALRAENQFSLLMSCWDKVPQGAIRKMARGARLNKKETDAVDLAATTIGWLFHADVTELARASNQESSDVRP